ncbi:hypothetical protein [uncultured Marivirga sp.]|uniref:hypothetical protein n=1 Tax=uncultured Marivirga sp. TaxID=1123707 RepID=UPI0030EC9F5C|tara:strand:+ start:323630 stop:324016 length:387 start_codon:yes stop_codon:yes gene_type:complete
MHNFDSRPIIPSSEVKTGTKEIEAFQNNTLRPIIKQLHSILLNHFSLLLSSKKGQYFKFSEDQKPSYIHRLFQKETRYKSELKGMIIGNLTSEEFGIYRLNYKVIDKRIYSIVEERIVTNQEELQDWN